MVNGKPLLCAPDTATTTLPVVAPDGTLTRMPVLLQVITFADVPLNVTVLAPWVAPKLVPPMLTTVPADPVDGSMFVIVNAGGRSVTAVDPHTDPAQALIVAEPVAKIRELP
jgi:hypothetical protein